MKKIVSILLLAAFAFCFKPVDETSAKVDFRDNYCGNYSCNKIYSHLSTVQKNVIVTETITANANVSKAELDQLLLITIMEGAYAVKVIDGKLITQGGGCLGKITLDSIYLNVSKGLAPESYVYKGKKI